LVAAGAAAGAVVGAAFGAGVAGAAQAVRIIEKTITTASNNWSLRIRADMWILPSLGFSDWHR
jgi:hypothetical protein